MSITKGVLLSDLAQVDEAINALIAGLAPSDLDRPVYTDWTLLQVLAHLASFDYARLVRRWLRQARGEVPPPAAPFDSEAWNQREVAAREGKAREEILAELRAHRRAIRELVEALSLADLELKTTTAAGTEGSVGEILWHMAVAHERQHLVEINHALAR